MKSFKLLFIVLSGSFIIAFLNFCTADKNKKGSSNGEKSSDFYIGWASANITPEGPVLLRGQVPARVSEGVLDSIRATVLAIESGTGDTSKKALLISCDLLGIPESLRDNIKIVLKEILPEVNTEQILINGTHTHTAPYCSQDSSSESMYGVKLKAMSPLECQKYISEKIGKAAVKAWKNRKPGGISYGLGQAVVGHNRVVADFSGRAQTYASTNRQDFSHIEGYEDHSVNLLYTYDTKSNLTGIIINIPCPSQVTEDLFKISADYWHETRTELGQRLGQDVYILPQCSAAGDQSPHLQIGAKAEERMRRFMFPDSIETGRKSIGQRKQIAIRIADAVTSVLPYMKASIDWNPVFDHRTEFVNLTRRFIDIKDVKNSLKGAKEYENQYNKLLLEIKENPGIMEKSRWYINITNIYSMRVRNDITLKYELLKKQPKMPVEVHVLRIGDIVIATNPFELYLDYGMRLKARSPAVQTFVVQLTDGYDGYLPTSRSVTGGAYGAVPATNQIGPEGGQELVEKTLDLINDVWKEKK